MFLKDQQLLHHQRPALDVRTSVREDNGGLDHEPDLQVRVDVLQLGSEGL